MTIAQTIRSHHRLALGLVLAGFLAGPALAQASVTCSARIRPAAAADYDVASEIVLQGRVVGYEGRLLLLKIAVGTLRVDVGDALIPTDSTVEMVAAKLQKNGLQRFLAREIRHTGSVVALRDGNGVPLAAPIQL